MNEKHGLRVVQWALLPLTVLLLAATAAAATSPAVPADAASASQLDEFVIQGKKLYQLRKEIVEAEDRFYKLYNELNQDDDYDVHCSKQAQLGSRLTERVCKPEFYSEAETEYAAAMFRGYYAPPPELIALERRDAYHARTVVLINRHPELLRMLRQRDQLEQRYLKTRKERFKERWIQF